MTRWLPVISLWALLTSLTLVTAQPHVQPTRYISGAGVTLGDLSVGTGTVAAAGAIRLANTAIIGWRNSSNDGDATLTVNATDDYVFGTTGATDAVYLGSTARGFEFGGGVLTLRVQSGNVLAYRNEAGFIGQRLSGDSLLYWSNTNGTPDTTADVAFARNAAGVVEVNSGTVGTFRDLRARRVTSGSDVNVGMVLANTSIQVGGVASDSSVVLMTPVTDTTGGAQGIIIQQADGTPAVFADLNGAATNGAMIYCSNCTIANPCASGGTGAIAKRLNGIWVCN